MFNNFSHRKSVAEGYEEVKNYITHGDGIRELGPILDYHDLTFQSEKQLQKFINLIMDAKNNTRVWENKGHTPSEIFEIFNKRNKNGENIIHFLRTQKSRIGRNEPYPCGSGKKYKRCCAIVHDEKTAQLSPDGCRLFYEIWYGLIGFVNEQMGLVEAKIKPMHPNTINDVMIHKVRKVLWKNPELIDKYINGADLPREKIKF